MMLKFGIPTLDELLDIDNAPLSPQPTGAPTSLTLLGPDGSGKSVLAFHLASQYRQHCRQILREQRRVDQPLPLIIYISSDLKYGSAHKVWENFGLYEPCARQIPFERLRLEVPRRALGPHKIYLQLLRPGGKDKESEAEFIGTGVQAASESTKSSIGFLDLASYTAGDDWLFVNSLIVNLQAAPRPQLDDGTRLHHLVLVDSVAGFETYVGEIDAYGMKQSRRARIAQSMRNTADHAHLVFVVEEPDEGKRLPEEYVTDVVVRLRSYREDHRHMRTVEIEKARARNHASGQHIFEIRGAGGSSTVEWENADRPPTRNAYVHVFHSLTHLNLMVGADRAPVVPSLSAQAVCPFGVRYLDELLDDDVSAKGKEVRSEARPLFGLHAASTTAIIGDPSTGKTILAERFIAEGFHELVQLVLGFYPVLLCRSDSDPLPETSVDACQKLSTLLFSPSVGDETREYGIRPSTRYEAIRALAMAWRDGEKDSLRRLQRAYEELELPLEQPGENWSTAAAEALTERRGHFSTVLPRLRSARYPLLWWKWVNFNLETGARGRDFRKLCVQKLFRHPNLRWPGVVLATNDRKAGRLAENCLGYLRAAINDVLDATYKDKAGREFRAYETPEDKLEALELLKEIIEEQLIVRRFEMDSISAPALFDMIHRNYIEAQYQVHGVYFPPRKELRHPRANRIRLVIDDLRILSNLCPSVANDSAFLPFLVFSLQREGITNVLVHTANLRPQDQPSDPVSQELTSLLGQIILLWDVPFENETRVAITAIPEHSAETEGIVRQVVHGEVEPMGHALSNVIGHRFFDVDVTRNFELYTGLQRGTPSLVPLSVYLFEATPTCRKYIENEDIMWRALFRPADTTRNGENGRVLWPVSASEYFAIRDLTHLPMAVKADQTIVDQVDQFWSLEPQTGTLMAQDKYLRAVVSKDSDEDPFGFFRGDPLHFEKSSDFKPFERRHYFQNSEYRSRAVDIAAYGSGVMPDRVPYMWDFSFILASPEAWNLASSDHVKAHGKSSPWFLRDKYFSDRALLVEPLKVGDVFTILQQPRKDRPALPWRVFFGACFAVSKRATGEFRPFDLAATSPETVSAFMLEIWLSEIVRELDTGQHAKDAEEWLQWRERLSAKVYTTPERGARFPLFELEQPSKYFNGQLWEDMPVAIKCLFRTWLLILDVLDFKGILDPSSHFEVRQPKYAHAGAVAVRHYYRTACDHQSRTAAAAAPWQNSQIALSMPGLFSVRGDSFLAAARASRSRLLASYAIDMLCSRRANLTRLQMGIGLPVRDVLEDPACRELRTALITVRKGGLAQITYGELRELGGNHSGPEEPGGLRWLFRNGIPDYDRVSRPLQKWFVRLFQWTDEYRASRGFSGLAAYDATIEDPNAPPPQLLGEDLRELGQLFDFLVAELRAAIRKHE